MKRRLKVFCDGGSRGNPGPAAWAFVVQEGEKIIQKGSGFLGTATNNIAEYQAVLNSLSWLVKNKKDYDEIVYYLDSELVVKQLNGFYKIKSENLRPLVIKIKNLQKRSSFQVSFNFVPRNKNKIADSLVNKELDAAFT